MKLKKQSLRLGQASCTSFIALLIFLLCGIPVANAQTPQQIAKKALAATVLLIMEDANGEPLGLGSGFFVDTNLIATNFHVIEGASRGTVKLVEQETEYTIEDFMAIDKNNDLAILQVAAPDVQPLPFGDSDTVEVGDAVYVASNPKGYFEGTFSDGIISAIRRDSTYKRLQMTAPVSSGSSGGPVLNDRGEVIGVSFATFRDGQNLNFAIPSNYLKALVAYNHGNANVRLGQYDAAIANYDTAIQFKPDDAKVYYNRGNAKFNIGQYFAAIQDYDTAIQLESTDIRVYIRRGFTKYELGQHASASKDFDTAIQLQNQETTKTDFGQHSTAIQDYNTVIRLNPDNAMVYMWRGLAKYRLGQHFAAIQDYDTVIRLNPDNARAHIWRGIAKASLGQYFAAIQDYDTALRLKPDYAKAHLNRGVAKHSLGQYAAAIQDYDTAIQFKPDYAKAYYNRGSAKYELSLYRSAVNDYGTAIQLKPDDAKTYYNRGVAKKKLGHSREAKQDFQKALKLAEQTGDKRLKTQIVSAIQNLR